MQFCLPSRRAREHEIRHIDADNEQDEHNHRHEYRSERSRWCRDFGMQHCAAVHGDCLAPIGLAGGPPKLAAYRHGLYLLWWVEEKQLPPAVVAAALAAGDLALVAVEYPTGCSPTGSGIV